MARPAMTPDEVLRNREALLDAAQRLYEADGLDGMSFRSLATEAGCSPTKPYTYFDSKADLVHGLRVRAYEWVRGVLSVAAASAADPVDALQEIASAYVRAGIDRPRMYELLYASNGATDERQPELIEAKHAALNVCRDVIAAAAESGGVTLTTDADTAAHLFWVAAHGLVSLELGGFLVVGRGIDELLPTLFSTMTTGMTGPTNEASN